VYATHCLLQTTVLLFDGDPTAGALFPRGADFPVIFRLHTGYGHVQLLLLAKYQKLESKESDRFLARVTECVELNSIPPYTKT
jgi:hypothetical protein